MPVVLSASKSGNTSPSSSPGIFSVTVEVSRLFSGCEDRREKRGGGNFQCERAAPFAYTSTVAVYNGPAQVAR